MASVSGIRIRYELDTKHLPELKVILKGLGLPVSGRKEELLMRAELGLRSDDEVKAALQSKNLPTTGTKSEMIKRFLSSIQWPKKPGFQCYKCSQSVQTKHKEEHLAKCWFGEGKTNAFHFVCHGRTKMMELHLVLPPTSTFAHLDQALRGVWMECCGHLSTFSCDPPQGTRRWEISMLSGGFCDYDIVRKTFHTPLSKVCKDRGVVLNYTYDMGDSTDAKIVFQGMVTLVREKPLPRAGIVLLRNELPIIPCYVCDQPATLNDGGSVEFALKGCDKYFYCSNECFNDFQEEDSEPRMLNPIINSPRCGCCGFSGAPYDLGPPKPGEKDVEMADGNMDDMYQGKYDDSEDEQQEKEDELGTNEENQQKNEEEPGKNGEKQQKNEEQRGKNEDKQQKEDEPGKNEDKQQEEEDESRKNEDKQQKNEEERGKNEHKVFVVGGGDTDGNSSTDDDDSDDSEFMRGFLLRDFLAQAMQ